LANSNKKNRTRLLLQPAIGDWTIYKPSLDTGAKRASTKGAPKLSEKDLNKANHLFSKMMERYLKNLEKSIDINLTLASCSLEMLNYVDILKGINVPVVQFKTTNENNPEQLFFCIDMNIANSMIDCATGSTFETSKVKALTEIEETILETLVTSSINSFFGENEGFDAKFVNYPRMYFDQNISNNNIFGYFEAEVISSQGAKGIIMFIAPVKNIEDMLQKNLQQRPRYKVDQLPVSVKNRIYVPVKAHLGTASISAKDLYGLAEGDVLLLDHPLNDLVSLTVGNSMMLTAQPGIRSNKIALQLLSSGSSKVERIKESNDATELSSSDEDDSENLLQDLSNSGIFEEEAVLI